MEIGERCVQNQQALTYNLTQNRMELSKYTKTKDVSKKNIKSGKIDCKAIMHRVK